MDTRLRSNVGSFIRVRNALAGGRALEGEGGDMLLRRLVFDALSDQRRPKLALFAAVDIPAVTELLI